MIIGVPRDQHVACSTAASSFIPFFEQDKMVIFNL
jgi:hypothetical protein